MPFLRLCRSGSWRILLCVALLLGTAILAEPASQEAEGLNQMAVGLTNQGQYEQAAALLTQALRLSPNDEVIRRNLSGLRTRWGNRLLQEGSLERAQEQYQAALELNSNESAALLGLGDIQLRNRQPRIAAELYRRAVAADPRNPDAYARLGEGYYQQRDPTAALSAWEQALALHEDVYLRRRVEEVQREIQIHTGYRGRESQHFTIKYDGQQREDIGRELLQILERAYNDVGYELGAYPPYEVQTIFYSEAEFVTSAHRTLDGRIRIGLKGLSLENPLLRSVLYHEYTHALIYAITRGNDVPRWVHEGLAVHMEKWRGPDFKQEAIRLARTGVVPPLDQSPYTHGSAAIEYLIERYGMTRVRQMLQRMGEGLPFAQAFQEAFQRDLATFQREFRDLLVRGY